MVLKLARTPEIKALFQIQSVVYQDQTRTHQDPVIGVIKVNSPRENDIDWLYGTSDLAPVSIKTFVTYDNQIPVDA